MPSFLRLMQPRAGAVAPNAAIALEGHVLGALALAAWADGLEVSVAVQRTQRLAHERFGATTWYLVKPAVGEWPIGGTVAIVATCDGQPMERFELPIATARDVTAPSFSSLTAPAARMLSDPRGETQVIALDHGPFDDAASPIVLVTLELGSSVVTGVVTEGSAGTLTMLPGAGLDHVAAITLSDLAGNARRIVEPCGSVSASAQRIT